MTQVVNPHADCVGSPRLLKTPGQTHALASLFHGVVVEPLPPHCSTYSNSCLGSVAVILVINFRTNVNLQSAIYGATFATCI